jgi:hypothetical protein
MSDIKDAVLEGVRDGAKALSEEIGQEQGSAKSKGFIDVILEKVVSRKLLVFGTATGLMWYGLDPDTWGMIAMCYIGGQSTIDFAKAWKWGK